MESFTKFGTALRLDDLHKSELFFVKMKTNYVLIQKLISLKIQNAGIRREINFWAVSKFLER